MIEKRSKLGESQTLQQFSRDVDEIEAWISEKLQTATDESYKDPTNIQVHICLLLPLTKSIEVDCKHSLSDRNPFLNGRMCELWIGDVSPAFKRNSVSNLVRWRSLGNIHCFFEIVAIDEASGWAKG